MEPLKTAYTTREYSVDRTTNGRINESKVNTTATTRNVGQTKNRNGFNNNREITMTGINNNNVKEARYKDERHVNNHGGKVYSSRERDLVALMNDHNLSGNLDDEEPPYFEIDENESSSYGRRESVGFDDENDYVNFNDRESGYNRNDYDFNERRDGKRDFKKRDIEYKKENFFGRKQDSFNEKQEDNFNRRKDYFNGRQESSGGKNDEGAIKKNSFSDPKQNLKTGIKVYTF